MRSAGLRAGAVALALSMTAGACLGRGGDPSVLVVAALTGAVQVRDAGGAWRDAAEGARLSAGDALRVASRGAAVLRRGEDSAVEVRANSEHPAELGLIAVDRLNVLSGDVLVVSNRVAPIAVESSGIAAAGSDAVYRFDRRLSIRVGVYQGSAVVETAGGSLEIPTLRQGIVSARLLPRGTRPLAIDESDPWDARFLGDVIELNTELEAQRRGYEAAFGARATVAQLERVYATALGFERLGFLGPHAGSTRHGDLLIGLVLTALVRQVHGGAPRDIFDRVMDLRAQDASWGMVARIMGIPGDALIAGVVRAIGVRTGDVRPDPGVIGRPTPGPGSPSPSPSPTGTGTPTPGPRPSPTPTGPSSPSPSPSPTGSPSPSPSPPPSPSPSPSPSPTAEPCILLPPLCPLG